MRNPKINLLPYREEAKKAAKKRYLAFLGIAFGLGVVVMLLVHTFFALQITTQGSRNEILEKDIASLEKQNAEIKKLRDEIAAAVARKQVVESLQANRSRAVMLLNQIVQPPANIYYRSVKQAGDLLTMNGFAPSNTSVSALIKQIESSEILFDPKLVESRAAVIDGVPLIEFGMTARIVDLAKVSAEKARNAATAARRAPPAKPQATPDAAGSPAPASPAMAQPAAPVAVPPPIPAAAAKPTAPVAPVAPAK